MSVDSSTILWVHTAGKQGLHSSHFLLPGSVRVFLWLLFGDFTALGIQFHPVPLQACIPGLSVSLLGCFPGLFSCESLSQGCPFWTWCLVPSILTVVLCHLTPTSDRGLQTHHPVLGLAISSVPCYFPKVPLLLAGWL